MTILDLSPEARIAHRLVAKLGREGAHRAVDALVAKFSNVELAALAAHWPTWARTKQLAPSGNWSSWGHLTSRGWGKTYGIAHHITDEIQSGRVKSLGLCAQKEEKTIEVQVGALLRAAPPWFRPTWVASSLQLLYPNGTIGFARTPQEPGNIRSENHELSWLSEIQSWPEATREEAYSNFVFCTRVGYARTIWDATPKRGHPILKRLLAMSAEHPELHPIVRGTIYENPHITRAALAKMELEYAGTQKGREELLGEMLDETEAALWKQAWIDKCRRPLPDRMQRRIISVDPAVTKRGGSDTTGLVDAGLDLDGQMLVLGNHSGKMTPPEWGGKVIDLYVRGDCDCCVVETNKGGDLVAANVKAHADRKKLNVVVLGKSEKPRRQAGVLFIKEVHARGSKADRAQPLATAYERGRVSHVVGSPGISEMEETLTTWEPEVSRYSPGDLDALVHAGIELLDLLTNVTDARAAFHGIEEIAAALSPAGGGARNVAQLLGGGTGGRI